MSYHAKLRCAGCGDHSFNVRWRGRNEDIVAYIENAIRPAMSKAHTEQSPFCESTECDLMLPINEAANGIGLRVEQ